MRRAVLLALVCLIPLGSLRALDSAPAADARARGPQPLRVEITLSRSEGARKIDSRSYVMWVNAGEGAATLKTGIEVPVAVTTFTPRADGSGPLPSATSYQYRNVGVSLKCEARALDDGRFRLELEFEQSSVVEGPRSQGELPRFRTANGRFKLVLRDGQAGEAAVATDPVSGESLRVETAVRVLS